MHRKHALIVLAVLLLCISQASAALVNFTGNVTLDFAGKPRLQSQADVITDPDKLGLAGCEDGPLTQNAFAEPQPISEIIPPSGFNVSRVVTVYDCTTDTLYIGLDICDTKIAWDADGDGSITGKSPNAIVPGFILRENFSDTGLEDYEIAIQANPAPVAHVAGAIEPNLRVFLESSLGGVAGSITAGFRTPVPPAVLPAGVTIEAWATGLDVEVAIHGLRTAYPTPVQAIKPIRIETRSGATGDLSTEDVTDALFELECLACLSITKGVSCSPNGPFLPSVQALRGAPVYFEIKVTNCGTDNLKNVVVTDTMLNAGGALLACTGCTGTASCIPGTITIGNLAVGATATFVCTVPTNPTYAANVLTPDATNTASVTGVGVTSGVVVPPVGPVSATVDVLVPSITCSKLVDDDSNFAVDPTEDNTPGKRQPTNNLSLLGGGNAWYQFCVTNNGEVPVDFTAIAGQNCPAFNDAFLETATLPGTGVNLDTLFRNALQARVGGTNILTPGQQICIVVGPVTFTCPGGPWPDTFTACGRATSTNICLPPSGGENVSTGPCNASVSCGPQICITKEVSCSPNGPFLPSVQALRGAPVYFKIVVTNCGGENLNNVILTDTITEQDNALLNCTGCTGGLPSPGCIPGVFNLGSLAIGASKTFVCTVPTNPAFSIPSLAEDGRNTASVTATGATSLTAVSAGPVFAVVDLLIPGIACSKLLDDDSNFAVDAGDNTPPTAHLDLRSDGVLDEEHVFYRFCVTNTGETDVSFAPDGSPPCPGFADNFIKVGGTSSDTCRDGTIVIPGTSFDLNGAFLAQLTGNVLPAGQTVCVTREVTFDERQLCCVQNFFQDRFSACGTATGTNICLPPLEQRGVSTGNCDADVTICIAPGIEITKQVSCFPDGPFTDSVTALRGATVYFKIVVRNLGGRNLTNVRITDTLTQETDNALLSCSGCTNGLNCIPTSTGLPVVTNIGNLIVGETKTFICTVLTNPAFNVVGTEIDATNTASVTADVVAPGSGDATTVSDLVEPDSTATVKLLVPSIVCSKLIDDDPNFAADGGDLTPPTNNLNLSQPPIGVKQAWYQFCVENTGEVKVDFTAGANPDCPNFLDAFIETADPAIPGTGADIDLAFRTALTNAFGGQFLPAGQKVCIVVGPVTFDETTLCPHAPFVDQFSACGNATDTGICLPQSGGESVSTGICTATVRICPPEICITKGVACTPAGPFLPSVTALRGSDIYWQVVVTNCGGKTLSNVTLTDTLVEVDNALLNCAGCTGVTPPICIPGVFNLGTMNPGDVKTIVCRFPTNPNFNVIGTLVDATNTAWVTAGVVNPDVGQPTTVSAPPVSATVNVLVPGIECDLLMDDDDNFAADAGDLTPPAVNLNLSMNGAPQVEHVWKKLTVCNTGEVPVSFVIGAGPCTDFDDPLVESFGIDVAQKFRDALVAAFGSQVLPPGQCVIVELGPIEFDENVLCPNTPVIVNRFTACGFATTTGICLPPAGGETVNTGLCQGTIMLCQPVLFQAVPGNSLGLNVDQMGHLGNSGEVISSAPGLFVLVPGNYWENFVAAAQVDQPYTLKNVTLIKQTPEFIQCADVFPPITVQQQGTAGIRLRWPLMYEAPGTTFTLIIQYGTNSLFDDDGILGPNIPAYFHENVWEWKVEATLESMKLLLELFHQIPFGLDEVPLISDEVLYPILQQKLDMIITLVAADNIRDAALLLGDFEMEVADACIAVSPRLPYPTGPGTGIAGTEENPACCKLLVDAEFVGFKLGLFQATK